MKGSCADSSTLWIDDVALRRRPVSDGQLKSDRECRDQEA